MRIVHYTSAHPWLTTRILLKMCVHSVSLGHQVALVAVDPDADEARIFNYDGVEVHLLAGGGRKGRWERATRMAWQVTRYASRLEADILQFHDPELIPYTIIGLRRRVPLIFDAHEDFVAQMEGKPWANGLKKAVIKTGLRCMQKLINWRATHIIAATEGVREDYDPRKSTAIRNLPILAEITSVARKPLNERSRDVCYIGAISDVRGIVEMVKALEYCKLVDQFHLAGRFTTEALRQEIEAMPGWSKVTYYGYIDRAQIVDILGRVRAGLVALHPTPNHIHSIPIKLLEYLCAGVPSIASNFPYWKNFVEEGETGVFVNPKDPMAIAAALDNIVSDKAAKHFDTFMTDDTRYRFSWEEEVLILDDVYRRCKKP